MTNMLTPLIVDAGMLRLSQASKFHARLPIRIVHPGGEFFKASVG